ncbi:MAG: WD40 repeat domain-containing protein [Armatimonadota bacterium]|nr:WD40 repeat domain-containing protein [Armatimonadota bacterium]
MPALVWMRGGTEYGVNKILFNRDGTRFVTSGDDGLVKIFRTSDGHLLRTIVADTTYADGLAFSPDGSVLATTSFDHKIKLWRFSDGVLLREWVADPYVAYNVQFSPDGSLLASGSTTGRVSLWNPNSGQLVRSLQGPNAYVFDMVFTPDGSTLISGDSLRTLRWWNVHTGASIRTINAHGWGLGDIDLSPNGTRIATIADSSPTELKIWNVSDGTLVRTITPDQFSAAEVEWHPDGNSIYSTGRFGLRRWNVATGAQMDHEPNADYQLAISPDGETILHSGTGAYGLVESESVYQRHADDLAFIRIVSSHTSWVTAMDERYGLPFVASGCGYFESSVILWDKVTGERVRTFEYSEVQDGVLDVEISANGAGVAASGNKGYARLWNVSNGNLIAQYNHGGVYPVSVYAFAFHPDGIRVLTGGNDGNLIFWDRFSGQPLFAIQPGGTTFAISFSPLGGFAAGVGGMLKFFDNEGTLIDQISAHSAALTSVAFSPRGDFVVTASYDGSWAMWRVSNRTLIRRVQAHSQLTSMDLSYDGTRVITSGRDGFVKTWSVATGALQESYNKETGQGHGGTNAVTWVDGIAKFAYGRSDGTVGLAVSSPRTRR